MKTLLIVASLCAAAFAFDTAWAASDAPARDFRAAATDPTVHAPVGAADLHRPDCGINRLSVIWGPDRQPGAYVCFGQLNKP